MADDVLPITATTLAIIKTALYVEGQSEEVALRIAALVPALRDLIVAGQDVAALLNKPLKDIAELEAIIAEQAKFVGE